MNEISAKTSLSRYKLRKLIDIRKRHDIGEDVIGAVGHRTKRKSVPDMEIIKRLDSGCDISTIARDLGFGWTAVWNRAHELGYKYISTQNKWIKE